MQAHRHIHSPDEIELLIAESRDGGLLEPDEHERLQRALKLNLRQAKQLMVPRRRMAALDIDTPLNEVVAIVASSPYSRLPVYRESLDNVVGVLHTRDLVQWFVDGSTAVDAGRADPADLGRARERDGRPGAAPLPRAARAPGAGRGRVRRHRRRDHARGRAVGARRRGGRRVQGRRAGGGAAARRARPPARAPWPVHDAAAALETAWETDATTVGGLVTAALGDLPEPGDKATIGRFLVPGGAGGRPRARIGAGHTCRA